MDEFEYDEIDENQYTYWIKRIKEGKKIDPTCAYYDKEYKKYFCSYHSKDALLKVLQDLGYKYIQVVVDEETDKNPFTEEQMKHQKISYEAYIFLKSLKTKICERLEDIYEIWVDKDIDQDNFMLCFNFEYAYTLNINLSFSKDDNVIKIYLTSTINNEKIDDEIWYEVDEKNEENIYSKIEDFYNNVYKKEYDIK